MTETCETIRNWQLETFGKLASTKRLVERAGEEFEELRAATQEYHAMLADPNVDAEYVHERRQHLITEAADVVIVLSAFPGLWEAVEAKMAINRGRSWNVRDDGTAYHVKEGERA